MEISRKSGQEAFSIGDREAELKLIDFWQWSQSDILNNTLRGVLAEFMVCKALEVMSEVRMDWDAFDVSYQGLKIEVKSSAYLQSWVQQKNSRISFDIRPTVGWCTETNTRTGKRERQSDVYIFCLLEHKDKATVNPLNLEQWKFYILPTSVLNQEVPLQKSITLNSLLAFKPRTCKFTELKFFIDRLITDN